MVYMRLIKSKLSVSTVAYTEYSYIAYDAIQRVVLSDVCRYLYMINVYDIVFNI